MSKFSDWVETIGGVTVAAERIGVTPGAVRHWLHGIRRPRPKLAEKIERVSEGAVPRQSLLWPEHPTSQDAA